MKNKWLRRAAFTTAIFLGVWTIFTVWVEGSGGEHMVKFGTSSDTLRVLITYDPDPIYDLDKQVCESLAKGLAENGYEVTVISPSDAAKLDLKSFRCVVVCANTYNWAPDNAVVNFIESSIIPDKQIVAITLGSGSTTESQERLLEHIRQSRGQIIASQEWWLMRPNDETRLDEDNVAVAVDQAYQMGIALATQIRSLTF